MSNESSAQIFTEAEDFMAAHLQAYLRSGGAEGHILDIRSSGGWLLGTHCLIRYKGRKSGKIYATPLCYTAIGGEVAIIGSKGGADHHPAWYLNLVEFAEVDFQIATQAFRATWRQPEGAEREKVWNLMEEAFPFFASYKASTDREIPVVLMNPIETIPVFTEAGLG